MRRGLWMIVALFGVLFTCVTGSWAIDVASAPYGDDSSLFLFEKALYPYVLKFSHYTDTSGGKTTTWYGLGLRGPWFKDRSYQNNAWYQNGFLYIDINGKPTLARPDVLVKRARILESGKRALVEYLFERDDALVRLRFLMREESPVLFTEVAVEPKAPLKSFAVTAVCYPGAYTFHMDGERHVQTAVRDVPPRPEAERRWTDLDPTRESWLFIADPQFDPAKPGHRDGGNGCAGMYIHPEGMGAVTTCPTYYPAIVTVTARPDVRRLRLGFEEIRANISQDQARKHVQDTSAQVQAIFQEDDFLPQRLSRFDARVEGATVQTLAKHPAGKALAVATATSLQQATNAVQTARNDRQSLQKEDAALSTLDAYQRRMSTMRRRAGNRLSILCFAGASYYAYGLEEARKALEKAGPTELTISYLTLNPEAHTYSYFPGSIDELYRYDAVFMLDSDLAALPTDQQLSLRTYVTDGGGLALFGGWYSFAAGKPSPLTDLLPLTNEAGPFGLRQSTAPLTYHTKLSVLKGVAIPANLVSPWYHALSATKGASILVTLGGKPWLAARQAGLGRTLACAGTLFGEAAAGKTLYFQSPAWPEMLAAMVRWLAGK